MESLAISKMNIRLLLKDRLSLFWSLALPSVMLFLNRSSINSKEALVFWWVYIVFNSYLYGIGLHALNEKDSGVLSIIFSIKWIPIKFFMGLLLTQVIYSFVCLSLFNVIPMLLFNFNYVELMIQSVLTIIVMIPVAFVGYNLTYLNRLYSSTVGAISNMVVFLGFILISFDSPFNKVNPFIIIGNLVNNIHNLRTILLYVGVSILLIFISVPSILRFNPLSKESR